MKPGLCGQAIGEVITVEQKYSDMFDLLRADAGAWKYFNMLPDYVRDQISSRASNVNSFSRLQAYAENLLKGGR